MGLDYAFYCKHCGNSYSAMDVCSCIINQAGIKEKDRCSKCSGTGYHKKEKCEKCNGTGEKKSSWW
jgi:DnaJ-class molecular chaperone